MFECLSLFLLWYKTEGLWACLFLLSVLRWIRLDSIFTSYFQYKLFSLIIFNLSMLWSNIRSYGFFIRQFGFGLWTQLVFILYSYFLSQHYCAFCHYFYPEVVFSIKKNKIQECSCFYEVHIRKQEITKVPTWQGFPTRVTGILELFWNPAKVWAWFLREPFIAFFDLNGLINMSSQRWPRLLIARSIDTHFEQYFKVLIVLFCL